MCHDDINIKVSIIVPVYNVEAYLERCVYSLVNQTYSNVEIVLVDDGSTDSSGVMCDDYARRFHNIIVLHKENGGLSSARNFALPFISGKYVTFVDSDDYVELYFVEYMLEPILCNTSGCDIDMVICRNTSENDDEIDKKWITYPIIDRHQILKEYLTPQLALKEMCYIRKFGASACGKLISTAIVKKFLFPIGKLYEDLATVFHMIGASKQIVFLDHSMYHYINRYGSIRHSVWTPAVNDVMTAANELLGYIDMNYPSIHDAGIYRYFISANEFYMRAFYENNYLKIISPVKCKLIKLLPQIMHNEDVPILRKIQFLMMIYTPYLYRYLRQIIRKK